MAKDLSYPVMGQPDVLDTRLAESLSNSRARLGKSLLDVQRDLRIKAAFIAAIESGDLSVFQNRGVIPGYVRSYARYLDLDPEETYRKFRAETGFAVSSPTFGGAVKQPAARQSAIGAGFDRPRGFALPAIPFSAIGSVLVLATLVAGLGYGGWTVLRNIQRVQFAPAEEIPLAVSDVGDISAPNAPGLVEPALSDLASPVAATALAELYRDQEAEVPILVPRDGPIAAINPDLIQPADKPIPAVADTTAETIAAAVAAAVATVEGPTLPQAADPASKLTIVAERSAWIRVYLENGTVIFESILEKGDTYSPPDGVGVPLIWAGNSGSVYVKVGDALHGPLGSGTRAAKGILLDAKSLAEKFPLVEQVPEVISQTIGADSPRPAATDVAIQ